MDTPDGASEGGEEAGDTELSLSGDLEDIGGDESLNWLRSVGAGGCGIEIIFSGPSITRCHQVNYSSLLLL